MLFSSKNPPPGYYVYVYLRETESLSGKKGTPYYVGKGKGKRAWEKRKGEVGKPRKNENILIVEWDLSELLSFITERKFIRWFGRLDKKSGILRNKTDGGEGVSGYVVTDDRKQKQRNAMLNNVQAGTHNLTDALRQQIIEEGKNFLYGNSEWHRNNTLKQIKENKHPSQTLKTCPHCLITCDSANYSRSHGENCEKFTGKKRKMLHFTVTYQTCTICNKTMNLSNFKKYGHGENCRFK